MKLIHKYQSGNVLFLILIAIVLFAALSYAITQNSRGGGSATTEPTVLGSAQVTQIGSDLQAGAAQMEVSGTSISNIKLHDGNGPGAWNVSALPCTSGTGCLFINSGGGVPFPFMPTNVEKAGTTLPNIELYEIADNAIIQGVANNQPVLLLLISQISQTACQDLNNGLGISGIPSAHSLVAGTPLTAAPGQYEACWAPSDMTGVYIYYHVFATP